MGHNYGIVFQGEYEYYSYKNVEDHLESQGVLREQHTHGLRQVVVLFDIICGICRFIGQFSKENTNIIVIEVFETIFRTQVYFENKILIDYNR